MLSNYRTISNLLFIKKMIGKKSSFDPAEQLFEHKQPLTLTLLRLTQHCTIVADEIPLNRLEKWVGLTGLVPSWHTSYFEGWC